MEAAKKDEKKEKIKALRLQEDRKKRLPLLLTDLSSIAGYEVSERDVLTLDEIDQHSISLNSSDFDFNYLNVSYPLAKSTELKKKLQVLDAELNNCNYLTLHHWSEIAVLKLNTRFTISNMQRLIDFDKDSFYIHSLDYINGLWVDLYSDYWYLDGKTELREILELRVFGKDWIKKVAAQL